MLVQQFYGVEKYGSYVNNRFIPCYINYDEKPGRDLYDHYEIGGGPSVAVVNPDGSLYDILTSYRGDPDQYLIRVKNTAEGIDTYDAIRKAYDKDPTDLKNISALASKYMRMWQAMKAFPLSQQILQRAEEAKNIDVPFQGETTINIYEGARFIVGLGEWIEYQNTDELESFRADFPQSMLIEDVYNQLARAYLELPLSDQSDIFFNDLKEKYSEDAYKLRRFVEYHIRTGKDLDECEIVARKMVALDPESRSLKQVAADLFIKNNHLKSALDLYGPTYIRDHMENTRELNSYAWYWAVNQKNLDHALVCIKKAFEVDPQNDNLLDTMSMVYWKMGEHQKAIDIEEKAYKMNPRSIYQERIEKIKEDMVK